jgi:hypothetical protein
MGSQNGALSYKEIHHNMYVSPASLEVKVFVKAVDGANAGFVFAAQGVVHATEDSNDAYGGVFFGYDSSTVRLWAPSRLSVSSYGYIISVGYGWGAAYSKGNYDGERGVQHSHIAEVKVVVRPELAAVRMGWWAACRLVSADVVDSRRCSSVACPSSPPPPFPLLITAGLRLGLVPHVCSSRLGVL